MYDTINRLTSLHININKQTLYYVNVYTAYKIENREIIEFLDDEISHTSCGLMLWKK